jgi:hypothetical protein
MAWYRSRAGTIRADNDSGPVGMNFKKNFSLREIADATSRASAPAPGPAYVDLPDYFWQGRLDANGNVHYYKVCLPN